MINIIAKCSIDSIVDFIESDKIKNSITYIKKSRVIKKSLIFLNENDELVIPSIDFDIRYVLIEEI